MQDNVLIQTFCDVIEPRLQAKWATLTMIQNYQPTLQGVSTLPLVLLEHIGDRRYGFARTDMQLTYDASDSAQDEHQIPTTTVQVIETRLQISALLIQNPSDLTLPTPNDILRYSAMLLSADVILKALRDVGLNVMRILDIRNPYSEDDRDTYEAHPSFDIIVQHYDDLVLDTPRVESIVSDIRAV